MATWQSRYTDPKAPASFTGKRKFYHEIKKRFPVNSKQVDKFLQTQDAYTIYRPAKLKFPTRPMISVGLDFQWDMDLADVANLKKDNDGITFLLVAIDILSRYAWVVPLPNKTGVAVVKGLEEMIGKRFPVQVRTDFGKEFANRAVQTFFKQQNIHHFIARNPPKASVCERFIRTLREKMYRYFEHANSYRYLDILQDLVDSYNNTTHRSIGMAPSAVTYDNENQLWEAQYKRGRKKKERFKLAVGDMVRISHMKHPFSRGYQQQYTEEIFWVASKFHRQNFALYQLKDCQDETIQGTFYQAELQKVFKPEDTLWKVEKVVKQRRKGRKQEYFIKWLNFPKECNSWVSEDDLQDI